MLDNLKDEIVQKKLEKLKKFIDDDELAYVKKYEDIGLYFKEEDYIEEINEKDKSIHSNYDNIEKIKKKIDKIENEGKQYERWIEKEEEENENLIYLLNFLMSVNK